ncbi:MAG: glycosyltransferase family 2 protein [Pseudomonadales bacterium]|nr:glycosyltransferase family 2 protein [Pseudomonadales bacterium]
MTDIDLSIVVPMYNEEENVQPLIQKISSIFVEHSLQVELIVVNDGSTDNTAKALAAHAADAQINIRCIELQRNFGQTAAMQAGIDAAEGEFIATMDGDLQNDPADIPRMLEELQQRDLDLLQGWRFDRQDDLYSRKIPSRIANKLIQSVTGVKLHDYGCSLKVYRAEILKQVRLYGEMHRFIPVWIANITGPNRIGETKVSHHARQFGESKYGISRTFRVIVDLLAAFFFLRFRARPSHFFGILGLLVGLISGVIFVYLGIDKFIFGNDIGNRPLLLVSNILGMASLQFLTTGVLAEMMSRILFQGSEHKEYVVRHDRLNRD